MLRSRRTFSINSTNARKRPRTNARKRAARIPQEYTQHRILHWVFLERVIWGLMLGVPITELQNVGIFTEVLYLWKRPPVTCIMLNPINKRYGVLISDPQKGASVVCRKVNPALCWRNSRFLSVFVECYRNCGISYEPSMLLSHLGL